MRLIDEIKGVKNDDKGSIDVEKKEPQTLNLDSVMDKIETAELQLNKLEEEYGDDSKSG